MIGDAGAFYSLYMTVGIIVAFYLQIAYGKESLIRENMTWCYHLYYFDAVLMN